jgi:ubiquinone/menaquinone biosynthesis C-methylase UbiE
MMMSGNYPLGYTDAEARRLTLQAAVFQTLTEDVLKRAGLGAGMNVLDIGCGAGDSSMLIARFVGPSGSVVGLDRNENSVKIARKRSRGAQLDNIRFVVSEIADYMPDASFDALIGRLVLVFLTNQLAGIEKLIAHLRPRGIVAFQEIDIASVQIPHPTRLLDQVRNWIAQAFAATGAAEMSIGSKLPAIFKHIGLPCPDMTAAQRVDGAPDSILYAYHVATLKSLLPVIEHANITSLAEIDIDTLLERMHAEAREHGHVVYGPRLVSAWSRKPDAHGR